MKLELSHGGHSKKDRKGALVTFAVKADGKGTSFATLPEALRERVAKAAPAEAGEDDALFTLPLGDDEVAQRLYVFGVGRRTELSPRKARALLRSVIKRLTKNGERSCVVDFPFSLTRLTSAEAREFLLRTAVLSSYTFPAYKSGEKETPSLSSLAFDASRGPWLGAPKEDAERELVEAGFVTTIAAFVRDLGNTPPCDMTPRIFAEKARKAAEVRGVRVRILGKAEIVKEKMGGLLAVNRGSAEEPRFVILEYRGAGKTESPVALVGKGVTFDSGGISIKGAERMGDMKWDMMGAATVVGTVLAAADLKLPVNLVALAPLTENLPSGTAYKPGDIVRFRNGKTAEIDNTDAEGRVILADALDFAGEWKPAAIVDYATLTGAALVALGLEAAICFTDDDSLAAALIDAGERTDERLWRLPLWDDYKENIKSDWADFKNTGGKYGGSINGALFLKEFVDPKTPWAHLDIAPTAYYERDHAGYPVGATAYGVALTLRWLRDRAAKSQDKAPARAEKKR